MARKTAVIALAIAAAISYGCGAIPQSKYYQLTAPGEASPDPVGDPLPVTLLIGPLKASHLYREDRLVYATDSEEMGTYQVHRWAEPPTEMLQGLLWRSLRASHRYSAVYLLSSSSHGDFLLQGNLYDFKELSGSTLAARLNMELELREVKTGAIVWTLQLLSRRTREEQRRFLGGRGAGQGCTALRKRIRNRLERIFCSTRQEVVWQFGRTGRCGAYLSSVPQRRLL